MALGVVPEYSYITPPTLVATTTNREAQMYIQGLPPQRDVGYVTSETPFALYLWNGTVDEAVLVSISGDEGTKGINWDIQTPETVHAQKSARVVVTVTIEGPLLFTGVITFQSFCGTIHFTVTGTRAPHLSGDVGYLFTPHDWSDGLNETLEWLTDVMIAHDRTEQRAQLRILPRRSFDLRLTASGSERRLLDQWLAARKIRSLFMPVWRDLGHLDSDIAAGNEVLYLDPVGYDYAVGRPVAVWDATRKEIRTITGIGQNYLAVDAPFEEDWPQGSQVAPCRYGTASAQRRLSRFTEDVGIWQFTLHALGESLLPVFDSPELYRDLPVCPFVPHWSGGDETVDNHWLTLDNASGIVELDIMSEEPIFARSASFMLVGRSNIDLFMRFLFSCAGRLAPFWLSSDGREFELSIGSAADDSEIIIENISYAYSLAGSPSRSHIELITTDGTVIRRMITGVESQPDGTEKILIDSGLPMAVSAANLNRCSWLELVRLDTDEISLHWVDGNCLQVTLPIVALP